MGKMTTLIYIKRLWMRQRGAVSPFLFGMLAGVAIFSASMRSQAQIQTKRIYEEQAARAAETADTYRRAVEGALMAETNADFGNLDTARINQYVSKSVGGGTRSGDDVAWGAIDMSNSYNGTNIGSSQRVMIAATDDDYVRAEVASLAAGGNANTMAQNSLTDREDVLTIDTSNIRQKQIQATLSNMNKQAEVLYGFWAENGRFPTVLEYNTNIDPKTDLRTFWGDPIIYVFTNDDEVRLRATTPWGQQLFSEALKMN